MANSLSTQERNENLREVVYSPDSQLRRPGQFIRSMISDTVASRELAWRLLSRSLKAKYRESLLGYVWLLLPPVITTLIWVFLNSSNIVNISETKIPYPVYVLVGTTLWQGFGDAISDPIKQFSLSGSMLSKISFPREALFLAGFGEILINFAIRLVLLMILFPFFQLEYPNTLIVAPIGILSLLLFGYSIGLLLLPIGMIFSDVKEGIVIFRTIWFYVTPIVYRRPTTWPGNILAKYNPVSPLIITSREMLTSGDLTQLTAFGIVSVITIAFIIIGWVTYRLSIPHIVERMKVR